MIKRLSTICTYILFNGELGCTGSINHSVNFQLCGNETKESVWSIQLTRCPSPPPPLLFNSQSCKSTGCNSIQSTSLLQFHSSTPGQYALHCGPPLLPLPSSPPASPSPEQRISPRSRQDIPVSPSPPQQKRSVVDD